jgi:hypothetical protein
LEKSSLTTGFLVYFEVALFTAKINFEIDFCRLNIHFIELDFSTLITDQQGVC